MHGRTSRRFQPIWSVYFHLVANRYYRSTPSKANHLPEKTLHMDTNTQRELAQTFLDSHTDSGTLVLPNAWDAASAIIYETAGFDAIGTSSAGIAASLGYPDGEVLAREQMLAVVERIAHSVNVPVSADIEAGYGDTPKAVAETVTKTIETGAVGVNLEDGTGDPDDPLLDPEVHAERIQAARDAAVLGGVPLVINGRTDVF